MEIVVALILMAACWFAWQVARERFYLENRQIIESACYLALIGLAVVGPAIFIIIIIITALLLSAHDSRSIGPHGCDPFGYGALDSKQHGNRPDVTALADFTDCTLTIRRGL